MGYRAAIKYGYSSARVKAMESRLMSPAAMQGMINAKDASSMIALLIQTDYNRFLAEFGGVNIRQSMIDFALSKSFADSVSKLVQITPKGEREIIRGLAGKWELNNVKLAIEAKERGAAYDEISRYIIDYGRYGQLAIKEAMHEDTMEGLISRLSKNSPYSSIMESASAAYSSGKEASSALAAIDAGYYKSREGIIDALKQRREHALRIVRLDIDMRNIIVLVRAKKRGLNFEDASPALVSRGGIRIDSLRRTFQGSDGVEGFVSQLHAMDLADAIPAYRKNGQLITFEIAMRNYIFEASARILRHSVLSIGTIIAYVYLKEMELFALRILIKSKAYGLEKEEVSRLISWRTS